ncbi:NADH:flavin oxidoreductase [Rubrimonas cliftonensis]|uniref:2,4-dienoyl-CoA reductase n=1 Tax=Rubrimonas cliftonensis TaxID=89524 RepID=A0A1H4E0B1_9RHOB|nr:NADH:flavin oxidoreductase [Rubrimonas cliftonensis]SEA78030.1 2,4-dienoyl-CoA reductase [Rubrimonas cliftonensis]
MLDARPKADPLLQPYALKHLTLRNRLISTAHEPAYTEGGLPKDRYRLYHVEKAKGGIGMTMIGGSACVAPDSPQAFGNIELWRDECVDWLARLAEDVHAHGAAVMIQITHLGRRGTWAKGEWLPLLAPSHIREPAHRAFPKAMEDWDVERVVTAYADAAEKVQAAGLDGFELECYGHLIDQFWSPLTNRRDDALGGDLDGRMAFGNRVIEAIRKRVGPDFIVGARMVCDEQQDGGIDRREGLEIARRLAASGAIDFINVIRGHIDTEEGLSRVIPGMGERSGPHLDFAGEVREAARITTMHASRIQDVATARHAVEAGKLDLVGMTRAHMADPHIVRKIMAGLEAEIRPCVGMGYCIDSIYQGEAVCIHNPATGREATMPHVISRSEGPRRKVVVVGAGPGGLEAARVAAARGHSVTLLEAADEPGGQVRLTAALKRRREILGIIDWRVAECARRGVDMRLNAWAEAEDVLAEGPDVAIIATGGLPCTGFLSEGEELATTSWDILSGAAKPAREVLVFDDNGAHAGLTVAEFLAEAGSRVEIVTPERTLGPDVGGTSFPPYFRAFSRHGVRATLNLRLRGVRREGNRLRALLWDEYGEATVEREVDQVVVEHGATPLDDLYFALKDGSSNRGAVAMEAFREGRAQPLAEGFALFRIGDAVASRNIHAAVYDALRLTNAL